MEHYPRWIRLHPVSTDETLATAVQARIHDPLWLLGRQWQMGELRHDGGATPIDVRVEGVVASIDRLRGGTGDSLPIDPQKVPLEALVEREPVPEDGLAGLKLRSDAGLQLLRMLWKAGLATEARAWIQRSGFDVPGPLDGASRDFLDWAEGRVPDGTRLAQAIPAALADGTASPAETPVLRAWLEWYATRFQAPPAGASPTWSPEHLEYSFAVAAPGTQGESVLVASGHTEPRLDWYAFDAGGGTLGTAGQPRARRYFRIPAPLNFVGMPNPRFWTFEDSSSRFDVIDALAQGDPSSATLMLLDFALLYGDDWFLVPVPLEPWTVFDAQSVLVTDCFGDVTTVRRPTARWNVYQLAGAGGPSSLFVHTPPAEAVEGPPLEEVHLLRDELANVAWAIERVVPTPMGPGAATRATEPAPSRPGAAGLTWTLTPDAPPAGWFPLLPVEVGRLALGVLWSAPDAAPGGRILAELRAPRARLQQEELPSVGVRVSRRWQSARSTDGAIHFWVGRDKSPRAGATALGIRFDAVEWK